MSTRRGMPWMFRLTAACGAVFVFTVFVMIAALFGDPESAINAWFNEYAGWLLAGEVGLTCVVGFAAMLFDREPPEPPARGNAS